MFRICRSDFHHTKIKWLITPPFSIRKKWNFYFIPLFSYVYYNIYLFVSDKIFKFTLYWNFKRIEFHFHSGNTSHFSTDLLFVNHFLIACFFRDVFPWSFESWVNIDWVNLLNVVFLRIRKPQWFFLIFVDRIHWLFLVLRVVFWIFWFGSIFVDFFAVF